MTVDVVVPEDHPLNGLHPVRAPVWWGWKGGVGKRCDVEVHTGRQVVLRIEKRFNRFERLLAKMLRAPNEVRRPLDSMNSLIWELSDGTRDFQTIVHHLNATFEEEATPVVERSTAAIRGFVALGVMKLLPMPLEMSRGQPNLVPCRLNRTSNDAVRTWISGPEVAMPSENQNRPCAQMEGRCVGMRNVWNLIPCTMHLLAKHRAHPMSTPALVARGVRQGRVNNRLHTTQQRFLPCLGTPKGSHPFARLPG